MPESAEKRQKGGISYYRCYYLHLLRELVSPICGIFFVKGKSPLQELYIGLLICPYIQKQKNAQKYSKTIRICLVKRWNLSTIDLKKSNAALPHDCNIKKLCLQYYCLGFEENLYLKANIECSNQWARYYLFDS